MRKRTSAIWSISVEELKNIVKNSDSLSKVLKHFGLHNKGGNAKTLKKRLEEDKIDYSHISLGMNSNKGRKFPSKAFPLEDVMIENSTYSRGLLKKRLLKNGMIENKCIICDQLPEHNNQKLVMVLDHINGKHDDHRIENLRMLCPNCNSQQKTFAGRSLRKKYNCKTCGKEIKKYSKLELCKKCLCIYRRTVNRPSKEILLKEIEETNYCAVGRKYGVSDNSIRKWIK